MLAQLRNRAYKHAIMERLNGSDPEACVPNGGRTQQLFTIAMFAVMGRVSKLDGLVSEDEINYASSIMRQMGFDTLQRQEAINYFDQGKQLNTDVMQCVQDLLRVIGPRSELAQLFLRIQCRLAYTKGELRFKEKILLRDVAEVLGYDKTELLDLCRDLQRHADFWQPHSGGFLRNAYGVLQLEPDVEIRRAYLRLMSRYHPDKLIRDNLNEESLRLAQEKSMAISNAYETLCGYRKAH